MVFHSVNTQNFPTPTNKNVSIGIPQVSVGVFIVNIDGLDLVRTFATLFHTNNQFNDTNNINTTQWMMISNTQLNGKPEVCDKCKRTNKKASAILNWYRTKET